MSYLRMADSAYPLSEFDIRKLFPDVSFPAVFVPPDGYVLVQPTTPPDFNPITQGLLELQPVEVNGQWQQAFEVQELYTTQDERDQAIADETEIIRTDKLFQVDLIAKAKRDAIVAGISAAEMASWPIKRAEALAYTSSGLDSDAPSLGKEAAKRDITLADLVQKVLSKAETLSNLEAEIAGNCGLLQDAIQAASDLNAIDAINLDGGWPV